MLNSVTIRSGRVGVSSRWESCSSADINNINVAISHNHFDSLESLHWIIGLLTATCSSLLENKCTKVAGTKYHGD